MTSPGSMRAGGERVERSCSESNAFAVPSNVVLRGAGDLDHGAVGGEVPAQDREAAPRVDRIARRVHDLAVGRGDVHRCEVLGDGLAR